jgi:hypothetical protein
LGYYGLNNAKRVLTKVDMWPKRYVNRPRLFAFAVVLGMVLAPLLPNTAIAESLEVLFAKAQTNAALRDRFIDIYVEREGLPDYVQSMDYSRTIGQLARTHILVRLNDGDYSSTSHAMAYGRGYPSTISFGPKMFHPGHRYADFRSVGVHEAAHAKFWATGEVNYLDRLKDDELEEIRLRGGLYTLLELDAIKTQKAHSSWQYTSGQFRQGQESYRQKWLAKLEELRNRPYMYDIKRILDRMRRIY